MERLAFNTAEHKLEELEKYGFQKITIWGENCYVYDFVPYTSIDSSYFVIDYKGEISIAWVDFRRNQDKFLILIFNLIKDGLVVKENKYENN